MMNKEVVVKRKQTKVTIAFDYKEKMNRAMVEWRKTSARGVKKHTATETLYKRM